MDIAAPCRGDSKDMIREKLIAISQCMPDLAPADSPAPQVAGGANGAVKNEDATEKFISDLISISYEESTDARPNGQP